MRFFTSGQTTEWLSARFGFSYTGLVFLAFLFVPNLFWTRRRPEGYSARGENRVLRSLEGIGQALVCAVVLCFTDFNPRPWSAWTLWLALAAVLMCLYEVWWIRYFLGPKTLADFYSSLLGIPVAGAALPVLAFFCLGLYGRNLWMLLAVAVLGVGHIGIHLQHRRALRNT